MNETLSRALVLLVVGMITVFLILWLLIIIGNLLIRFTNRYLPLPEVVVKSADDIGSVPGRTVAAIVAAVDVVTGGKGKVEKIEKDNN